MREGKASHHLKMVGGVALLGFYNIGVHIGLLHTEHARRQSLGADMPATSAFGRWLVGKGCPKNKTKGTLKRVAYMMRLNLRLAENAGCKSAKMDNSAAGAVAGDDATVEEDDNGDLGADKDVVMENQYMHWRDLVTDSDGISEVKLRRKGVCDSYWVDYEPRLHRDPEKYNS